MCALLPSSASIPVKCTVCMSHHYIVESRDMQSQQLRKLKRKAIKYRRRPTSPVSDQRSLKDDGWKQLPSNSPVSSPMPFDVNYFLGTPAAREEIELPESSKSAAMQQAQARYACYKHQAESSQSRNDGVSVHMPAEDCERQGPQVFFKDKADTTSILSPFSAGLKNGKSPHPPVIPEPNSNGNLLPWTRHVRPRGNAELTCNTATSMEKLESAFSQLALRDDVDSPVTSDDTSGGLTTGENNLPGKGRGHDRELARRSAERTGSPSLETLPLLPRIDTQSFAFSWGILSPSTSSDRQSPHPATALYSPWHESKAHGSSTASRMSISLSLPSNRSTQCSQSGSLVLSFSPSSTPMTTFFSAFASPTAQTPPTSPFFSPSSASCEKAFEPLSVSCTSSYRGSSSESEPDSDSPQECTPISTTAAGGRYNPEAEACSSTSVDEGDNLLAQRIINDTSTLERQGSDRDYSTKKSDG